MATDFNLPTAIEIYNWRDRLMLNLRTLWTRAVFWVTAFWGAIGAWWAAVATDDKTTLLAKFPLLQYLTPMQLLIAAFVTILSARVWPQKPPGAITMEEAQAGKFASTDYTDHRVR
jgi:hypothetical protein